MPTLIQAEFSLNVDQPPSLFVLRIDGVERVGQPYDFWIHVYPTNDLPFDPTTAIGEQATLHFTRLNPDDTLTDLRTIRGLVTETEDGLEGAGRNRSYRLRLRPAIVLLEQISGQEIFVGKTIPEVIRAKLTQGSIDFGLDLRLRDPKAYSEGTSETEWKDAPAPPHPEEPRLVTQYKETDLAFVMRLAEHAGLSMFFEPREEGDRVVFTDHNGGFTEAEDAIPYQAGEVTHGILTMVRRTKWVPTTVFTCDFNYRAPNQTLNDDAGHQVFDTLGGRADLDDALPGLVAEYAPNVKNAKEADRIALVRVEEQRTISDRMRGTAELPSLAAGLRFKISGHPSFPDTRELVMMEVEHTFTAPAPRYDSVQTQYTAAFDAVPLVAGSKAFDVRVERTTPKPRIHGLVTAVVVAAGTGSTERQHLDGVGRYSIKLHFAQGDVPTMPRVRMAQSHAGPGYGIHFPLRPGTEVLVAFVDGDPDRPVIVGAVPNAVNPSPVVASTAADAVNEPNRILTRSGILIEISDGDPPA